MPQIYFIIGVSGSGKTTIGKLLSKELDFAFHDADNFHSENNIQKMAAGLPLDDQDRYDWLKKINEAALNNIQSNVHGVIACSALKEKYREILSENIQQHIIWIYLKGEYSLIYDRLQKRKDHFMSANLLSSQFSILEEPDYGITISIDQHPTKIIEQIMKKINKSEFGLVGLGVMGKSLARNFANNGFKLSLYNRYVKNYEEGIAEKFISQFNILHFAQGFEDIKSFVDSVQRPRKIILMISAGIETDSFINEILPFLDKGDILIDGGNSNYLDTKRRYAYLEKYNIYFIGTGVSGGEYGALHGPSIMPSGDYNSYLEVEYYFKAIAAKDKNGIPCCSYIGVEGSGHFIKMVHNGIEYAEMQLIAESYAYLRYACGFSPDQISTVFSEWNQGELKNYLLEITATILLKKENEEWLIDLILDKAGNKGTGNWATIAASQLGAPATMITAALFARYLSTIKENYSEITFDNKNSNSENSILLTHIKNAYQLARIANHQQGFFLIQTASQNFQWQLNLSEIARIWTNGCIIRSTFMEELVDLFQNESDLFSSGHILAQTENLYPSLKEFCISSLQNNIPIPCHMAAMEYFQTLSSNFPTANIIQAQRDYFGAHRFERRDDTSGKTYHVEWQ